MWHGLADLNEYTKGIGKAPSKRRAEKAMEEIMDMDCPPTEEEMSGMDASYVEAMRKQLKGKR